ncbi:hypothetical protein DICPUDRAFT_146520 [Dictyostelium purpureum]|uniref:Rho-GAP domain-containing protein n=1 Tax=Dictyostelium purpureum TaxID=5786 RepID=F0Z667_DICPU|nr:uncharacterized protein DICPUDRAFT_146520 [Dictyostelium purpureum]EGC40604.1 hypothetical protein DICPUDRAFT_146520 [Dictyostelium purpureum]|eukprot:XP_003282940.1 hypothetical protein DICPUDRAFT_146520 [Dictyostelium purpureum]
MEKEHRKKKSVGNLFGHSNSSPNLKSYLKDDGPQKEGFADIPENEEISSNLYKVQSTPTSPLSSTNNISLNSSGNSIGGGSPSPSSSYQNSPIMNSKKKPSRLAQAFKRVKHNNKLKKEIEELSSKTGLNQQYTRSNLPFNIIPDSSVDGGGGGGGAPSGHSRQNSKVSKKHQRKSRFIEPVALSTEDYSDIPRIIKVSIEFLFEKCLRVPGLFRESANALELQRLSQIFEKGEDIDLSNYNDPHCIGGLLKLYFRERPSPIFPYDLHKTIYNVLNEEDSSNKIRMLLENGLSKGQYLILRYLFELLNSVHNNSEHNRMNYQNLAICFAPSLIQSFDTSCIDVIERLIDQYEAIFSVVVVVDNGSNGGSIDLSSSPTILTESLVDSNKSGDDNSNNYQVVLDSSQVLDQLYSSNSGHLRASNGIKKSPLLGSSNLRKSVSPKLNNRKSVNFNKLSNEVIPPPNMDIQDNDEEVEEDAEVVSRPRKNSTALYLSRVGRNRPNSWNTNKKQAPKNQLGSTPTKRLHSVNSIDYNKPAEPFDRSAININKGSLNKQMTIINPSPSTPESDCTSIGSDEDEELKIIKPLSRSPSVNNLVEEVNKLNMDIESTNVNCGGTVDNSTYYRGDDSTDTNNNTTSTTTAQGTPVLATHYSNIEKPVYNYNRFLQPANRSLSNPNIKNFSVPASSTAISNHSKYNKRSLFSPVRKQSIVSSKKNTFSGTASPTFNSSNSGISDSGTNTPSLSTQSSKTDLTSSVSSISSNISTSSNSSTSSNISTSSSVGKGTTGNSISTSSNIGKNATTTTTTTTVSHNKTPSTSSASSISSGAATTISPIKKVSHQHTNSLSSIPPSIVGGSGSAASSSTNSNSSSPNLTSSTPSPVRPSLNHTVSASTLISKFNQFENNNNQSPSTANWKSGVEKNKQAPVKKSVSIFEKKS